MNAKIENSLVHSIDETIPFIIERRALDHTNTDALNQASSPVALLFKGQIKMLINRKGGKNYSIGSA